MKEYILDHWDDICTEEPSLTK